MAAPIDHYAVLNVSPSAEAEVIKAAYRALMMKYHPDQHQGDAATAERRAKEITEAFAVLSDPAKRAAYDRQKRSSTAHSDPTKGGNGPEQGGERRASSNAAGSSTGSKDKARTDSSAAGSEKAGSSSRSGADSRRTDGDGARAKSAPAVSARVWGTIAVVAVAAAVRLCTTSQPAPNTALSLPPTPIPTPANATTPIEEGKLVEWDRSKDGDGHVYRAGDLTVRLESGPADSGLVPPKMTVGFGQAETFTEVGVTGSENPMAQFVITKLDKTAQGSGVLFASYSYGAHCCTTFQLLEKVGGRWLTVPLGTFDGELTDKMIKDVDGDGTNEFVNADDSFLYVFTSYAGSFAPPVITRVVSGKAVIASVDPRYRAAFKSDIAAAQTACREHNNGGCAAFVADAQRLGEGEVAWTEMLSNYDKASDWVLPTRCEIATKESCPKEHEIVFSDFPSALAWFLPANGYGALKATSDNPQSVMPSFSCAKVESQNLKLVCASPRLSALDQQLSQAFSEALGRASDQKVLRESQRAWIVSRNNAANDVNVIAAIYQQRLVQLGGI